MKVAFLGLGRMGRELVLHVLDAGHDVTVWNRTPAATSEARSRGAVVADAPADAVRGADVVVTVLFGPDAVRQVVVDAELPLASGLAWLDVTTIAPEDAASLAAWAAARDVGYVHAPVIGSLGPARAGALGTLVGGPDGAVAAALPLVRLWADPQRIHVVDTPAKAAAGKLVANLAVATTMQALSEALLLGHGGGMSTDEVLDLLTDRTPLQVMAALKGDMVRGDAFADTQFSADALAKDAGLMMRTAPGPLPALSAAYASLANAQASGLGDHDFAVIARPVR